MPQIVYLQRTPKGKEPPVPSRELTLVEGLGIEGDHHARPRSSRQVLLMAEENCAAFILAPGQVRENLVTRGIDLQNLPVGTLLEIGAAALEITKDCEPCSFIEGIRSGLRERMQRRRGMLARVVRGGDIRVGDEITLRPPAGATRAP